MSNTRLRRRGAHPNSSQSCATGGGGGGVDKSGSGQTAARFAAPDAPGGSAASESPASVAAGFAADLAARFAADAARFEAEATALANTPRVFQRSICSKCSAPVEPPSVHFLCGHSFHANCLADGTAAQDAEPECPTCAPQRRRVREHAAMVASRAVAHDDFYRQLDEAADGFGVVADFFSKGVLRL